MRHTRSRSILILSSLISVGAPLAVADIYEGFDMPTSGGKPLGESGKTSVGWHSSWLGSKGKPLFEAGDLRIAGLKSVGGSALLRGERKPKSIGQGVAMRQIAESYSGDVYGSFRFKAGKLIDKSVVGLLLSMPGDGPLTPGKATFAFCPKRWGSPYGMTSAGKSRMAKVESGVECSPGELYLVVWKLKNLPTAGQRKKIALNMWVLDEAQAAHFAEKGFSEEVLQMAEPGGKPEQASQIAHREIRSAKRGVFRGMLISCFSIGVPKVAFDEIRVSQTSLADAVGLADGSR